MVKANQFEFGKRDIPKVGVATMVLSIYDQLSKKKESEHSVQIIPGHSRADLLTSEVLFDCPSLQNYSTQNEDDVVGLSILLVGD